MLTLSCGTNLHAHAMQSPASGSYGNMVPLAGMHQLYLHLKFNSSFFASRYLELHNFWMQRKRVSFYFSSKSNQNNAKKNHKTITELISMHIFQPLQPT